MVDTRWRGDIGRLKIDDVVVDIPRRRILCAEGDVELPQRVFDLLLVFMAAPGVLHSRSSLFESVWPGVIVEDASLTQTVWMLRRALGPERKHWIRTVSKSGYVFEPAAVVEVASLQAQADFQTMVAPQAHTPEAVADIDSAGAVARFGSGFHAWIALVRRGLAILLLMCSMAFIQSSDGHFNGSRAMYVRPAAIAITVVAVQDPATTFAYRWPVVLLKDWLSSRLEYFPEVVLITEDDFSADLLSEPPRLVLLAVGPSPSTGNEMVLRATFDASLSSHEGRRNGPSPPAAMSKIEVRGPADRMPAMIDALSQQVIARIVPDRMQASWPPLSLDPKAAERYARAIESIDRRDWKEALAQTKAVVQMAPHFGPVRMRLAEVLSNQGQPGRAIEQMAVARRLMTPVSEDAQQMLDAMALAMDRRQSAQAAEAYTALSAMYPARSDFALKKAEHLTTSGRAEEAIAILSPKQWDRLSRRVRIQQQMELGRAALTLGYASQARRNALEVERLIRDAGEGWSMQLGDARFLFSSAYHSEFPKHPLPRLYERAARTFDTSGYRLGALYSRFMAETVRPIGQPVGAISMPTLLAEARATGHSGLEFEILVQMAYKAYDMGQLAEYRTLIGEAESVAKLAGDPISQQTVDFSLLNEDYLIGDFRSVDLRIGRLLKADLSGDSAFVAAHSEATLSMLRGRYSHAMQALRQGVQAATDDGALPQTPMTEGGAACLRSDLHMRTGALATAKAEWVRCRRSSVEDLRVPALLTGAALELLSANRPNAIALIADADAGIELLADGPARWELSLQSADLHMRAGAAAQAERVYLEILPKAERAGYAWLAAIAETGLAETAAVRRDWDASQRHAAAARRLPMASVWALRSRLEQIDIVHALHATEQPSSAIQVQAQALAAEAQMLGDTLVQAPLEALLADPAVRRAGGSAGSASREGYVGGLDWLLSPPRTDTR